MADKAKGFAAKLSLDEQGELIGLLHDLGKYSAEFQGYLKSAIGLIDEDKDDYVDAQDLKGKVDHSTAGAQLIWNELSRQGKFGPIVGQLLSLCIASHHSGLIDCISPGAATPSIDKFTKRIRTPEKRSHFEEVQAKMDASIIARLHELIISPKLVEGIKNLIFKVVQHDSGNELITRFKIGLLVRFLFSCLIDADRIDTADAEKPRAAKQRQHGNYIEWAMLIERLEKKLTEFSDAEPIDKIRRNIADHCRDAAQRDKGIFTLSVPTGGGKTLASLRFALHHTQQHKMER
ncbi:CRISPR-associated endonuclease Cas3'', partial [Nitrosomonas sp.]|uniref:CRISPR-associated endonuclease Cas3'' n=1 Tax=Nitrosomonas sp. TaxID=42353 RepID=UPI001D7FFA5C